MSRSPASFRHSTNVAAKDNVGLTALYSVLGHIELLSKHDQK
jgi:hypothetical protein